MVQIMYGLLLLRTTSWSRLAHARSCIIYKEKGPERISLKKAEASLRISTRKLHEVLPRFNRYSGSRNEIMSEKRFRGDLLMSDNPLSTDIWGFRKASCVARESLRHIPYISEHLHSRYSHRMKSSGHQFDPRMPSMLDGFDCLNISLREWPNKILNHNRHAVDGIIGVIVHDYLVKKKGLCARVVNWALPMQ